MVDMRLTFGRLERFKALAEASLSPAANVNRIFRDQHRQRADLEERLGLELFRQDRGRIRLTPPGRLAFEWATGLVDSADDLVEELREIEAGRRGMVNLVASQAIASYRLPPVLARFNAALPDVRLSVLVADTDRALELVGEDRVDFAVVPIQPKIVDAPLRATALGDEQVVFVAAATAKDPPPRITVRELESVPFVEADHGIERRERELRRVGVKRRRIVVRFGHPEAMKEAIRSGLGIGMLPRSAVAEDLARGDLRQVRVEGHKFGVPICLVQRADAAELSPTQRRLLGDLTAAFGAEGPPR